MRQLLLLLFISILSTITNAQKINFDAVDKYFSLTDSLKKDIPLSNESWNELLAYEGVQLYIKNNALNENDLKSYKRNFEIAYMPKNDSILKARLKNPEKYFTLWVFNNYKIQEKELKEYYQKIKSNQSTYLDSIYANCYSLLPKKMQKKATKTIIYIIPLMNDAVAEEENIVLTLYGAYHFDKLKYGAIGGHEIHHVLRKNKKINNVEDKFLYEALTMILNEGSADLIDKKYTAMENCPIDLKYYEYLMETGPNAITMLESAVSAHLNKTQLITKNDLPNIASMSGHIPGCYMATIIERNGLKNELIASIDDPVKFILLYNRAAKIDKEKPLYFSENVITYISKIK